MKDQYDTPKGPGTARTSASTAPGSAREDIKQNRAAGLVKAAQKHGTGITQSPTIEAQSTAGNTYQSARQDTNTGSGARPETPGRFKIATSAPTNARTLNRAPAGWLK